MTELRLKNEYEANLEAQLMHMEKMDAYREKILINNNYTIHEFHDAIRINMHQQEINALQERNRLIDTYLTELWKTKLKSKNSKKKLKS
jgi:hypothetical protein